MAHTEYRPPSWPFSAYSSTGGAFEGVIDDHVSPFGYMKGEGIDAGYGEHEWICNKDKPRTDGIFNNLGPVDGKISGASKCSNNLTQKGRQN